MPTVGGISDKTAAMEAALILTLEEASLMRLNLEAKEFVAAVPHFNLDIEALMRLSLSEIPTLWQVRSSKRGHTFNGFYGASGQGFGASGDLIYEYGQRSSEVSEESSSNWRELGNLVMALENQVSQNGLQDCELFRLLTEQRLKPHILERFFEVSQVV